MAEADWAVLVAGVIVLVAAVAVLVATSVLFFFVAGMTSVAGVSVLVAGGAVPEDDKDVPVDVALLLLLNWAE